MPCLDPIADEIEHRQTAARLNRVTRMLCSSLHSLERNHSEALDFLLSNVEGLNSWWVQHQEQDRKRLEREKREMDRVLRKNAALSKLSSEDKKVLGLSEE